MWSHCAQVIFDVIHIVQVQSLEFCSEMDSGGWMILINAFYVNSNISFLDLLASIQVSFDLVVCFAV